RICELDGFNAAWDRSLLPCGPTIARGEHDLRLAGEETVLTVDEGHRKDVAYTARQRLGGPVPSAVGGVNKCGGRAIGLDPPVSRRHPAHVDGPIQMRGTT